MPYLGVGSPNVSKMKPELGIGNENENDVVPHYHDFCAQSEDDASSTSSTAAVAEDVGYNEEKKRSAAGEDDENPGITKKIKAAASQPGGTTISSHNTSLASPLPNMVLNMKTNKNYGAIVGRVHAEFMQSNKQLTDMDGEELKKMADEALQELKTKYSPVDANGHPLDDEAARQTLKQCFRNLYHRLKKSAQQSSQPQPSNLSDASSLTSQSEDDGVIRTKTEHDVVLDLRLKEYKDIVSKFSKDYLDGRYNNISQTGKAVLKEMKNSLRQTGGRILKRYGKGYIEVDDKTALTIIRQGVEKTSESVYLPVDSRSVEETPSQKSSRAKSSTRSQPQEERPRDKTPTKPHLSEIERGGLKDYLGPSIVDFFNDVDDYGWEFKYKSYSSEHIAVKKGFDVKDPKLVEGVDKLTGIRSIVNWAYRNGAFERYAKTESGENFIERVCERKGLCVQTFGAMIFAEEREEQNDSQHRTSRTVSPSSSPTASVSETQKVKFDLQGDERRDYWLVYKDVRAKLAAASDDASSKDFYEVLMNCMKKNMVNTEQWNKKKGILKKYIKDYEEMKIECADDTFVRDTLLPSLITEAKENLCA